MNNSVFAAGLQPTSMPPCDEKRQQMASGGGSSPPVFSKEEKDTLRRLLRDEIEHAQFVLHHDDVQRLKAVEYFTNIMAKVYEL